MQTRYEGRTIGDCELLKYMIENSSTKSRAMSIPLPTHMAFS
jgi:hypothetical protein